MKIYKTLFLLFIYFCMTSVSAQPFSNVSISNVSIINTATLDFSPTFHKDGIVFVSNKDIQGKKKIFDKLFKQKAMSLFMARRDNKGMLGAPQPFAMELVSKVHEGPIAFEKDYQTVYISRNNNRKRSGRAKYADDDVDYMKIYVSQLGEKGWSTPKEMALNLKQSDACHPALSPDGNRLYFSSNRPNGFGGMDLYVCEKMNGQWSKPMNLGAKVNSDKNDVFPYVNADGKLYFSSDREGGRGGLDIYYCNINKENTTTAILNDTSTPLSIGTPFNSENDDFGFILDPNNKNGYFTSNRSGGVGGDDIYAFNVLNETLPKPEKEVVVVKETKTETPKKEVVVVKETKTEMPILKSEIKNEIPLVLDVEKNIAGINKPAIEPKNVTPPVETLKETIYQLKNIYYNFDDASIRKDASTTLDSLVIVLNTYPDMYIELAAYTDSRGTSQYNEILSKKRAENAANYLIKRGIDAKRLVQVHYGKRKSLNDCGGNNTPCPEGIHQINRRTEVRVIKRENVRR